ncbi:MAG TPA: polymer-forming cytoskeletal protein [Nitrospiria bacterium]|nr:polymer-forming cytoskeletal protein [Nitrospiria bacterium]
MFPKSSKEDREIKPEEIIAFLGKGTNFKGIITYNGTIRIDGNVEGEIISQGTLVVGEDATIDAEISVGKIISSGKINGNIIAKERIHLMHPAIQNGSVTAPILIIDEGVRFNGNCEMKSSGGEDLLKTQKEAATMGREPEKGSV